MFRNTLLAPLVLLLAFTLAGCGDGDRLRNEIVGKWELTDPGGKLLGGRIEFHPSGSVIVMERWLTGAGPRPKVLTGSYAFVDDLRIRMRVREGDGEPVERIVAVAINDNRMSLGFPDGSVVYQRR